MKHSTLSTLFLSLLALTACTQDDDLMMEAPNAVSFQVVNYVPRTKALTGAAYTYESFGVYAWSKATAVPYFMDNETVTLQKDKWLPSKTYYWPKEATVDFISYSPRVAKENAAVKIEPTKITFSGYTTKSAKVEADGSISTKSYADLSDLMYADKVVGMSSKTNANGDDLKDDKGNPYKTVPAYFRHALSRLSINMSQAFMSKTIEEKDGSTTRYKWVVKVNDAKLKGVDTKGNLVLNLSNTPNSDLTYTYPWTKPESGLWSDVSTPMQDLTLGHCTLEHAGKSILSGLYVMPQSLSKGKQQVTLDMTITTLRSTDGGEPKETFLTENVTRTVDLFIDRETLPSWKINYDITYNLVVNPTADPKDPGDDPDDPDLDDIEIHFDPAVSDWSTVDATATIKL